MPSQLRRLAYPPTKKKSGITTNSHVSGHIAGTSASELVSTRRPPADRVRPAQVGHQPVAHHDGHDAAPAQQVDEPIAPRGVHESHGRPPAGSPAGAKVTRSRSAPAARRYPGPVTVAEQAPILDPSDAERIVADLWALHAPSAADLGSHQDRNFLITARRAPSPGDSGTRVQGLPTC